ncbi:triose-phosphate isomerase [Roseicitreum antarcticum]|uniref:Triosephosphate isomerase n=1 Tax=Roseicitreum antarcticum TaxID=564137 RepID=A0A1H2WIH6_9RHOB|nr:triose-phosphate isomerase [Roseicitreum antarcticum]SDW80064.1 triosephosphate isomerase [Roseicitreum antarcticum]
MRRKLAAGNWKMNGLRADVAQVEALAQAFPDPGCDILICPPATLLAGFVPAGQGVVSLGGQDCHSATHGAHTGDVSAPMLADAGADYVILGHSERRADHGESSELVAQKVRAAHAAGLIAVVCVGETLAERDAGTTLDVVGAQLDGSLPDCVTAANTVIAYEPVWAIGTGRIPTLDQIAEVHDFLRARLADGAFAAHADGMRLLYGGSVKPDNAAEIFATANVDGALVGGASLKAADFGKIILALCAS